MRARKKKGKRRNDPASSARSPEKRAQIRYELAKQAALASEFVDDSSLETKSA